MLIGGCGRRWIHGSGVVRVTSPAVPLNTFNASGKVSLQGPLLGWPMRAESGGLVAGGSRLRAWGTAVGSLIVVLAALTACAGPYQYYEGTGIHDTTAAEVAGGWENVEGTRVVLRKGGTALFEKLDGQDFDFEDGWRLSGTGTWQLADDDGGQVVRLALAARTRVESRSSVTATDASTPEPPSTYAWSFYVDRDQHNELKLFFFYGDPDIGKTYVMRRETGS
ncbi:hypothetical protein [Streptomyces sp. NPDC093097]|uniref:hypothetical protein n=1 Tax=Streptomyces sp. NPDC093097 TaxID=3366027 RepID=UPI0038144791